MDNIKLIFDKRKLDTLIRLGVPDSALLELLKTGVAPKTEDDLINDYLKSVLVVKKFKNTWGGKRDGSGKKQTNSNTSSFHLEKQLDCQVVDKDIDKYIDKYIDIEVNSGEKNKKEYSSDFEELWSLYKPSSTSDGHISPKGAKPDAYKAYCKAKKQADAETIKTGVLVYLQSCKETDTYTSHLSTCLNKGYWVIDENDISLQRKKQQVEIENRILKNQLNREKQNV